MLAGRANTVLKEAAVDQVFEQTLDGVTEYWVMGHENMSWDAMFE